MIRPYYHTSLYARIDKKNIFVYLAAGIIITVADYGTFTGLYLAGAGLLVATIIAYIFGLIVSYYLNRYWVFSKGANLQKTVTNLWRYGAFLLINLLITYAMLDRMEAWYGLSPFIGKFVVGFFMIFWVYAGDKYWVFKGPKIGPIRLD